jgi:GNAT superfamily N-acetyltransferase
VLRTEKKVYGYYTLAAGSLPVQNLPPKAARKLPRHPVPVALLGRLAVDQAAQGRRLGAMLLFDALKRCVALSRSIGIYAVEVTAIDESARNFYAKYGFAPRLDGDLHLYLPISTIEKTTA